jgi:hypothetical protein
LISIKDDSDSSDSDGVSRCAYNPRYSHFSSSKKYESEMIFFGELKGQDYVMAELLLNALL